MEFIKPGINLDFIGKRKIAYLFSLLAVLATIFLLVWRGGPNYGVDFAGGMLIQIKLDRSHPSSDIRKALEAVQLGDSIIQELGEKDQFEYLVRVNRPDIEMAGLSEKVKQALALEFGQGVDIRRVEMVGPKVGKDLRQKALLAIFYALLLIAVYISWRFEFMLLRSGVMVALLVFVVTIAAGFGATISWLILIALLVTLASCWFLDLKFALGALIATMHDVIFTVGVFVLADKEFSLEIVAALLTIIGYSLNDTIVVFDRIRENLKRYKKQPFAEVMNRSINETLSRTILTAGTTLIVVVILFLMGGTVIHDFAFTMIVGIIIGTYSSIFVASPILLLWEKDASKKKNDKTK